MNSHGFPPRTFLEGRPPMRGNGQNDGAQPAIDSQALFKGTTEVVILHHGAKYRLRITRQGKLILNK